MPTLSCLTRTAAVLLAVLPAATITAPIRAEEARAATEGAEPARPAARAAGIVRVPGGKPAAGCPVYLILNARGKNLDESRYTLCGQAVTDKAGRFTLNSTTPRPRKGLLIVLAWRQGAAIGLGSVPPESDEPVEIDLHRVRKVRGAVKDSAGKPVAGAIITPERVTLQSETAGPLYWLGTVLPAPLGKLWVVRSDAKGEYLLTQAPVKGNLSLQVRRTGYNRGSTYLDARAPAPQPIILHRRTRIRGRLRLSDPAMPVEGVHVVAQQEYARATGRVKAGGIFEIDHVRPGALTLSVFVPGTSEWQPSAHMAVMVPEGKTLEGLVLPVEAVRGVRVTGRIVDEETGKGIPDLWVSTEAGAGQSTDAEGKYSFYARPGRVAVTLFRSTLQPANYFLSEERLQRSGTGVPGESLDLEEIRLRKGRTVTVRVVDAAGKPLKGALVRNEASVTPWDDMPLATNAHGEGVLLGLAPDASLRLSARTGSGYSLPVPVDLKTLSGPVTLVVKPEIATYLEGRVVDDAGKPVRGANVRVSAMYGRWGDYPATLKTDAEGRFRSEALPPEAEYSVKVQAPRHRTMMSERWKSTNGGRHDFGSIRLVRQLGIVVGTVVDARGRPVAGARVFNSGDAERPLQTTSDARGRFRLEGLESGGCYVAAEKAGHPLGLLYTLAPAREVRLVLRPMVPAPDSVELTAARERLALQLIDRTLAEAGTQPERWRERQRVIDLLVPRDILRATEIAMAAGQPERNSLSHDLGRVALKRSVEEAIACIRQVDHPFWRTRNLLSLAAESTPEQAPPILTAAVASARQVPELMQQLYLLAECAEGMRRRKMPGAEILLRECAARAARLGVQEGDAYTRGTVAERLAEIDLDAAVALIAPITDEASRQRHVANIAVRYVTRSPEKALQLLSTAGDEWQSQRAISKMCARLAADDPDGADRLIGKLQDRRQRIRALLWMAERIRDRKRALATLDRAEQELTAWAAVTTEDDTYDPPALYLAHAAWVAKELDAPAARRLMAKSLASRPALHVEYGDPLEQYRSHAKVALLMAHLDPEAGRNLLGILRPRMEAIKAPERSWAAAEIRRNLLLATAAADPTQAEAYLDTLKQSGANPDGIGTAEFILDPRIRREKLESALNLRSPEEDD